MKKIVAISLIALLLSLVLVDIGRFLWAWRAVSLAARESARFASSGQPNIAPDNGIPFEIKNTPGGVCTGPKGESHIGYTLNRIVRLTRQNQTKLSEAWNAHFSQ